MPWEIVKDHADCGPGKWAVVKETDGAVEGCHGSEEAAERQLAALYANEPDAARTEVDMSNEDTSRAAEFTGPQLFMRTYPLEDIRILSRAQGAEYADGRTVEAYVAVWDRETEIHDGEGHYREIIDRVAFNKAIADSRPQGNRQAWATRVFYNHGMTLFGTPSDRFSMPLGSPVDIQVEDRGLLTTTRYAATPLADEVLELIRSGDITGHSFTGRIVRSDPSRPRAGYRPSAGGRLPLVRRLELGLREYGPTPFPAYADTAVVGMRSMLAGLALPVLLSATREAEVAAEPADEVVRTAADDEPVGSDTPPDEGAVPDEPPTETPVEHSSRSTLLRRIATAKTTRPGLADPHSELRRARVQTITRPEGDGSK